MKISNRLFLLMFLSWIVLSGITYAGGVNSRPSYYSYNDLLSIAKDYQNQFAFDNYSYSQNGDVSFIPPGPTAGNNYYSIASSWARKNSALLSQYVGNLRTSDHTTEATNQAFTSSIRAQNWPYLDVDWGSMRANDGDLLFMRSNSAGGKLVHAYTGSWTHVAMISDKSKKQVLDSMPNDGVQYRTVDSSLYKNILCYGTKSVAGISQATAVNAIRRAGNPVYWGGLLGTPYWSDRVGTSLLRLSFYKKWSDKNDMGSMYCSKLVWYTFNKFAGGIDLDSNRTKCYVSELSNGVLTAWSWIGVSPDDIWGSNKTSRWWDLVQAFFLNYNGL